MMQAIAEARELDTGGSHEPHKLLMDVAECLIARLPESIIRLVRNEDEKITSALQPPKSGNHAADQVKVAER
jgi:hypothetical protein